MTAMAIATPTQGDPVSEAARLGEPDRYIAALYAPEPARGSLIALAAYSGDLARIAATVREPMLAAIRLQWWRDALASGERGAATGHPIADRLAPAIASGLLPLGLLLGMGDAAATRLTAPLVSDDQALKSHLSKSYAAAFMLASRALGATYSAELEAATQLAGQSYGLARLLAAGPALEPGLMADLASRAREALPRAAAAARRLDSALLPAFLPLTMTAPYLGQVEGTGAARPTPLQRWWRMWRANLGGRLS